jgi:hypothetical protein
MVDSSSRIVLLGGNRNRVGSMGRGQCRCNCLRRASARTGALVGIVTSLSIIIAFVISLRWVLSSLGPLNILIPIIQGLEIVWTLNHLTLWSRESLSS